MLSSGETYIGACAMLLYIILVKCSLCLSLMLGSSATTFVVNSVTIAGSSRRDIS